MEARELERLCQAQTVAERRRASARELFCHEDEHLSRPHGVSVIVAVHNGAGEIDQLIDSLLFQSLDRELFEVVFALNGCTDETRSLLEAERTSGIGITIIESDEANVSAARNSAIDVARFRYATIVDHDDALSKDYLSEALSLAHYRCVVVSNIARLEDGFLAEDFAQKLVDEAFAVSLVVPPEEVAICYRVYTLNAIKLAPTYMMKRIRFDPDLPHSEDVKYWRDLFVTFLPFTVKTPSRRDVYFRKVRPGSLSRRMSDAQYQAEPRLRIIEMIATDAPRSAFGSPGWIFDRELEISLRAFLAGLKAKAG